jgi:hypothetical protein
VHPGSLRDKAIVAHSRAHGRDTLSLPPLDRAQRHRQTTGTSKRERQRPVPRALSQTTSTWAHLAAPVAEWFAREISKPLSARHDLSAQPNQRNQRRVKGRSPLPEGKPVFKPKRVCHGCGKELDRRQTNCGQCAKDVNIERITNAARLGRVAAVAPEAQAKRAATQRIKAHARWDWKPSDQPTWLTSHFYSEKIQPRLASISSSSIAKCLNVSYPYANDIRKGRAPHPRHWQALTELAGLSHE